MAADYACPLINDLSRPRTRYTACTHAMHPCSGEGGREGERGRFSRAWGVDHRQRSLDENMYLSFVQALIIASYRDTRSMSRHPIIITQLRPVRPSLDNRLTARNYRNFESAGVGGHPRRHRSGFMAWLRVAFSTCTGTRTGDQGQNAVFSLSFPPPASPGEAQETPRALGRRPSLMIVPRTSIPLRCVTRDSR